MNEQERELDLMVAELEHENRLLRARNERLERETLAAPVQEPVAWMDGYRNIYSLEEKAAGCEDAVIPLVPAIQHWSDCAVHNEPAYPKGDCDCGGYTTPPAAPMQEPVIDKSAAIRIATVLGWEPPAAPVQEKSQQFTPEMNCSNYFKHEPVTGCACRWDSNDNRVVTCERHQGWLEVIAEWAGRAREAEAKIKAAPPAAQSCQTCEALARAVMMDQTAHDIATPAAHRQWVELTAKDKKELWNAGVNEWAILTVEKKCKEKNA